MAFTRTWNELTPAGGDPAGNIHIYFQQFKADVRERIESAGFTDWSSSVDHVKFANLKINAAGGNIKDSTDANILLSLTDAGNVNFLLQPLCYMYHAAALIMGPGQAAIQWAGADEVIDIRSMHDAGSNIGRVTIPANANGNYFMLGQSAPIAASAGNAITLSVRKNGVTELVRNQVVAPNSTKAMGLTVFGVASLVATDYVELLVGGDGYSAPALNGFLVARLPW